MARYDFRCFKCGLNIEVDCAIADRRQPVQCPRGCGPWAEMLFSPPPASNISIPRALRTNWSDVAPIGADGHAMTYGETVKDSRFDHYRPEVFEEAVKVEDKRKTRHLDRLKVKHAKRFEERAYGKVTVR